MKAVVQRVSRAALVIDDREHASIGRGLVVLACVEAGDTPDDRAWMARKLTQLRIFPDDQGKMNRSVADIAGEILLVSNFTVAGDCRKGNRPSFDAAMKPPQARDEFDALVQSVRDALGPSAASRVQTGVFAADMHVTIVNDGPVTLFMDSRTKPLV